MRKPTERRIESEDNAIFRRLKKLGTGRGIKKERSVLVSGPKTVADVMRTLPDRCEAWVSPGDPPPAGLPERAAWFHLSKALFRAVDVFGTGAPLLLIGVPPIAVWRVEDGLPAGCNLLVPFQDPENVGVVVRSAVAFGVKSVILLAGAGNPYHPKAIRTSGGAVFHASLRSGPTIEDLPPALPIVALSVEGEDAGGFGFPRTFALLPGVEGPGLPARLRDGAISIPISNNVESLNAATATAIALYLWSRQFGVGEVSD